MNNGVVEEQQVVFERPDPYMMYHLKTIFIRAEVDNLVVNKVFVDGGATVNLMSYSLFKKIRKTYEDLSPHNMVLSNYESKTSNILGVVQVDISVGSTSKLTLFMVIKSNANYNLLLGREWIHGIGVVPSTLHQRVAIWREDSIVKNIEADQSYYKVEVGTFERRNFDRNLEKIPT